MLTIQRERHRRALDLSAAVVARVGPGDLSRPSPCADWTLGGLLAHMIGQNLGFAAAVEARDRGVVPDEAFNPHPFDPVTFDVSVGRIGSVFMSIGEGDGDSLVHLPEISTERAFPVTTVLGFHLLDTLVHTWDVAAALGESWRPPDADLVTAALTLARSVPDGPARTRPDAAFAPSLPFPAPDPWSRTLSLLGRAPQSL